MKKFLFPILVFIAFFGIGNVLFAQTTSPVVTIFIEDFEIQPDSMTNISLGQAATWDTTSRISSTGSYCDTNFSAGVTRSYLETPVIDITGYVSVNLAFDHICYIEIFDKASVEVSFNGGNTWITMGASVYKGGSFLNSQTRDTAFTKASRPFDWHVASADSLWVPPSTTNAWFTENFDISPYLAIPSIATDSVKFRFALYDDPASPVGRVGLHTWYLDNIRVTAAPCELIPPTINLFAPFRYIEQYDDVVYFTGPYDFSAQFRDASLIDSAYMAVIYKPQNAGPWTYDTIHFAVVSGSNYFAEIPAQTIGDTVCYKLVAVDASACKNRTVSPVQGYTCFLVRDNLPPGCQTKPIF